MVLAGFLFGLFVAPVHLDHSSIVFEMGSPACAALKDASTPRGTGAAEESIHLRVGDVPAAGTPILNRELIVPAGIRVVVFSPHPDDESLAASGLVQRVRADEGKVRVVFMTNGDGYKEGVRRTLMKTDASSGDFITYGKMRHDEAVQAVCQLGLQPEDAIFLGFPDDGIDDLWTDFWSKPRPFISPFTHFDSPLYKDCYSHSVKYNGADLSNEIANLLKEFTPDWVVMPDLRDQHPDHYTTGIFVLDALRKLNQDGALSFANTQILTYLVHYRDYPEGRTWFASVNKSGVGGTPFIESILSQTQWYNLPLTSEEMEGKWNALKAHQSQFCMLGDFFKRFLRPPYEIFGKLNAAQVLAIPQIYTAALKRRSN
jgi:LmbE family N-acetylglucosaminyl deacetylase